MTSIESSFSTTRLAAARATIGAAFTQHSLRALGGDRSLDLHHVHVPMGEFTFNRLCYGAEVEVVAPRLEHFYLLQLTLAGTVEIESRGARMQLQPGMMVVMNPDRPYVKRWSRDATQIILRVERRLIDTLAARTEFAYAGFASTGRLAPLSRFVRYLETELADPAGTRAAERAAKPIADHLAHLMLDCIPHVGRPAAPAPAYVRRAEQCMRERLAEDLSASTIAGAAGISVRSLDNGFKAIHGTSMMRYLRDLRLDAAHARLQQAATTSVAQVAASVGWRHGGRFAASYHARFGYLPGMAAQGLRHCGH